MISFRNDYSEGCIPEIMEYLASTNFENTSGYGEDDYSERAKNIIKKKLKNDKVDVYFLVGGTQANLITISHSLRPYQSVIATEKGHISTHESGAIEATGHKVVELPSGDDGKLTVELIEKAFINDLAPHTVQNKMVYISNPTEVGTLYSKKELEKISKYCKKNGLYLYLDGARLAMALGSEKNDIQLEDYPKYVDAFCIGGTKCGALFGEALILINNELKKDIGHSIKQKGALLAKGRLLGLQFEKLFQKNLYEKYGKHASEMANLLKVGITKCGLKLKADSYTNQQFFIFPNDLIKKLEKKFVFEFWSTEDENNTVVRFVTSWATKKSDISEFLKELKSLI